ncbi:MAG: hypothetical protein GX591_12335 [Planctomycetes bacterium]|nr:hypothetical protein [Planctomycetota bacterium]
MTELSPAQRPDRTRCRPRRRGQVLVVTLLAIVLLAGLIFFVLNAGEQVNRRVIAQDAADAAVVSGATHLARSFNSIAAGNLAMSRMLAAIVTLDDLERFAEASHRQSDAFLGRMTAQASAVLPADRLRHATRRALDGIRDTLDEEHTLLEAYLPVIGELPLRDQTTYDLPGAEGPPPHGAFWRAARDLDLVNQATLAAAGALAQTSAARHARAAGADGGLLLPVLADPPAWRADWHAWHQDPERRTSLLVNGWPPELDFAPDDPADDELVAHRGGFFALLGWRSPWGYRDIHDPFFLGGGGGHGSRPGQPASTAWHPLGWRGYGPVQWMRGRVYDYWLDRLHYSVPYYSVPYYSGNRRVRPLLEGLQQIKLAYMFDPDFSGGDTARPLSLHDPDWQTDYWTARNRARGDAPELTAHFRIEIMSPYAPDDPRIDGILDDPYHSNVHDPQWIVQWGWNDRQVGIARVDLGARVTVHLSPPGDLELPEGVILPDQVTIVVRLNVRKNWRKIAEHIWHVEVSPQEWQAELERLNAGGALWAQVRGRLGLADLPPFDYTYDVPDFPWRILRDVFAGADFGRDVEVHNPANFTLADYPEALPAPILLDLDVGDYDAGDAADPWDDAGHDAPVRRDRFTFLGVARRGSQAVVWPSRFRTGNPGGAITAVAQAELYNPTSWDLWTQDWRVQLVPVTDMAAWADGLDEQRDAYRDVAGASDAAALLDMADVDAINEYLQALTRDGRLTGQAPIDALMEH